MWAEIVINNINKHYLTYQKRLGLIGHPPPTPLQQPQDIQCFLQKATLFSLCAFIQFAFSIPICFLLWLYNNESQLGPLGPAQSLLLPQILPKDWGRYDSISEWKKKMQQPLITFPGKEVLKLYVNFMISVHVRNCKIWSRKKAY